MTLSWSWAGDGFWTGGIIDAAGWVRRGGGLCGFICVSIFCSQEKAIFMIEETLNLISFLMNFPERAMPSIPLQR